MSDLTARLVSILRGAPQLMTVLGLARMLELPDWMVFSGAVYQPVWNHLTGRAPEHVPPRQQPAPVAAEPEWRVQ